MKVYSYIRFSSPEQKTGSSYSRQREYAQDWAKRHDMVLDTSLQMLDEGKSAYKGHHTKSGAMGQFLNLVKQGKIPQGSVLIVEAMDRLSRENLGVAWAQFQDIIQAGIRIVVARDGQEYNQKVLKGNQMALLIPIIQMLIANEESRQKSIRVSGGKKDRRERYLETGVIPTRRIPHWLSLSEDRMEFKARPEVVDQVKRIYQLFLDGNSMKSITKLMNQDPGWSPPPRGSAQRGGWIDSYVRALLGDPRLIGHYQFHEHDEHGKRIPTGEVMRDYYPAVIDPQTWQRVKDLKDQNSRPNLGKAGGGRKGANKNLFVHLVKCWYCGGPLHLDHKFLDIPNTQYLVCHNRLIKATDEKGRLVCQAKNLKYLEAEKVFFQRFENLDLSALLPDPDQKQIQVNVLNSQIQFLDSQIQEEERTMENLNPMIAKATTPQLQDLLLTKMDASMDRKTALIQEREAAEVELLKLTAETSQISDAVQQTQHLYTLLAETPESERPQLRAKIQAQIRSWVKRIVFRPEHDREETQRTIKGVRIHLHDGHSQTMMKRWLD